MRIAYVVLFIIYLASGDNVRGQGFSVDEDNAGSRVNRDGAYFVKDKARKLHFVFVPPTKKMFVDSAGDIRLFPALFPPGVFFREVEYPPSFVQLRSAGQPFVVYEIGGRFLALDAEYKLFSATIRNGRLFILAQDNDGDFIHLDNTHFTIYMRDGTRQSAKEVMNDYRSMSVLVDRSASMVGFDNDMGDALRVLADTIVQSDYCALYEFGYSVRVIVAPMRETCGSIFSRYSISRPDGGTPLFTALERAYRDAQDVDTISAIVIISDGAPTDTASPYLDGLSKSIPTFVLWIGNHTIDYIASYSTAHAVSRSGVESEVADFLRAVSFSVRGHQYFTLSSP